MARGTIDALCTYTKHRDKNAKKENDRMTDPTLPSLEYLLECSKQSLADLELMALNLSANCLRVARAEWEQAVAQREVAGVARWLLENREEILATARRTIEAQGVIAFPGSRKTA